MRSLPVALLTTVCVCAFVPSAQAATFKAGQRATVNITDGTKAKPVRYRASFTVPKSLIVKTVADGYSISSTQGCVSAVNGFSGGEGTTFAKALVDLPTFTEKLVRTGSARDTARYGEFAEDDGDRVFRVLSPSLSTPAFFGNEREWLGISFSNFADCVSVAQARSMAKSTSLTKR